MFQQKSVSDGKEQPGLPSQPVGPKLTPELEFISEVRTAIGAIPRPPTGERLGSITAEQAELFMASLKTSANKHLGINNFAQNETTEETLGKINQALLTKGYSIRLSIIPGKDRQTRGELNLDLVSLSPKPQQIDASEVNKLFRNLNLKQITYYLVDQHILSFGNSKDTLSLGVTQKIDPEKSLITIDPKAIEKFAKNLPEGMVVPITAKELERAVIFNEIGNYVANSGIKIPDFTVVEFTVPVGGEKLEIKAEVFALKETISDYVSLSLTNRFPAEVERILRTDQQQYAISRFILGHTVADVAKKHPEIAAKVIDTKSDSLRISEACKMLSSNQEFAKEVKAAALLPIGQLSRGAMTLGAK